MLSKNKKKIIRSLPILKYRRQSGLFLAEGPKIINDLLESKFVINFICATEDWFIANKAVVNKVECILVTQKELEKISTLKNPNQVLATVKTPEPNNIPVLSNELALLLDDIRDPGNLGTIIRTADWFGINHIICSESCVDVYNHKVVQSTMGSITRVEVYYTNLKKYISSVGSQVQVYGAVLEGANLYKAEPGEHGFLLIGNESNGISDELIPLITKKISIPFYSRLG
ncbi:MAG: RNA methyltransferase, partial [Bacteroidales bacterium]|nr:RNA methyltransferase [Bacteroidales bacterium]